MNLELYLRQERQRRKLTRADFARSVGVDRTEVWKWIHKGVIPRPAQMERIEIVSGGQVTWRDFQPKRPALHADLPLSDQVVKCHSR